MRGLGKSGALPDTPDLLMTPEGAPASRFASCFKPRPAESPGDPEA
jgi:hypothetical protein